MAHTPTQENSYARELRLRMLQQADRSRHRGGLSRVADWHEGAFEECPCETEYLELRRKAKLGHTCKPMNEGADAV